jgi:radical SAM protein with 4Fe4S-binding SPASM domain
VRSWERLQGLARSPQLLWNVLFRARYDFIYDQMPISVRRMSLAKRINLLRAGGNLVHRRLTPWSWPLHMNIELTSYCNLRCPICPTGARELNRRPEAMEVELFERLMAEAGPYLLTMSLWGWGEPLLHPRLADILRIARRYPVATLVSTNGQKLNDDRIIDTLIAHPPTVLIVAIDGLTDETNSRFRTGARLEPALSGVRRLAELKRQNNLKLPVLHMRYIPMKHNEHEVPLLSDFARQAGFDLATIRTLSIIDASEQPHREMIPDTAGLRAYAYADGRRVRRGDFICMEPFWFPAIYADGTVVGCDQDYNAQQPMGLLSESASFADIWSSRQAAGVRRLIRDTPQELSFCANCPFVDRPISHCSIEALNLYQPGQPIPSIRP